MRNHKVTGTSYEGWHIVRHQKDIAHQAEAEPSLDELHY
jgi:hypothetical protein